MTEFPGHPEDRLSRHRFTFVCIRSLYRLLVWPFRLLFARDVFISYARRDAHAYAAALGSRLSGGVKPFSCSSDILVARPGLRIPLPILWHAHWSRGRVVIASAAALTSGPMAREIRLFRWLEGALVVVRVPDVDASAATWSADTNGAPPVIEPGGQEALRVGTVSDAVVRHLEEVFVFWRQSRRIAVAAWAGLAAVVVAALFAGYFAMAATDKARDAENARKAEAKASASAARAAEAASQAQVKEARATEAAVQASAAASQASAAAAVATAEAASQSRRAAQLRKESSARALAAQAEDLLTVSPGRVEQALKLALAAVSEEPGAGTRSLRRVLSLAVPMRAEHALPCPTDAASLSRDGRWLAAGGWEKLCVLDLQQPGTAQVIAIEPGETVQALLFADDARLVVLTSDQTEATTLRLLKLSGKWSSQELRRGGALPHASVAAMHPGGRLLAWADEQGVLYLVDITAKGLPIVSSPIMHMAPPGKPFAVAFDPEGRALLMAAGTEVHLWDVSRPTEPRHAWGVPYQKDDLPFADGVPFAFDPSGPRFATSAQGLVVVRNIQDGEKVAPALPMSGVDALAFAADGSLHAHAADGRFRSWRRRPALYAEISGGSAVFGELPADRILRPTSSGMHAFAIQRRADNDESFASIRQLGSRIEIGRMPHRSWIRHLFPIGRGTSAISVGSDGRVRVWDDAMSASSRVQLGDGLADTVQPSRDGESVLFVQSVGLPMSPPDYTLVRQGFDGTRTVLSGKLPERPLALLEEGGAATGFVKFIGPRALWRLSPDRGASAARLMDLPPTGACQRKAAFSKDRFAVSGHAGAAYVGGTSGLLALPPASGAGCVTDLAFSADGRRLAVRFGNSRVVAADVESASVLLQIDPRLGSDGIALDGKGRYLLLFSGVPAVRSHDRWTPAMRLARVPEDNGASGVLLRQEDDLGHASCASTDGLHLALQVHGAVEVHALNGTPLPDLPRDVQPLDGVMRRCSFTAGGARLIAVTDKEVVRIELDSEILVREAHARLGMQTGR